MREACAKLTERQTEVLVLVAKGLTTKEIGAAIGAEKNTIDTHVVAILRRMKVRRMIEAAVIATKAGLV